MDPNKLPLCFDVYGIKFKISQLEHTNPAYIEALFSPYKIKCPHSQMYEFRFKQINSPTEIASFILPLLAEKDIWAIHGAGVCWQEKIFLFLGRSGSGKSTIAKLALKLDLKIVGDDLILAQLEKKDIKIKPFFYVIQDENKPFIKKISPTLITEGKLFCIFLLKSITDKTTVIKASSINKHELYPFLLWAKNPHILKRQMTFLDKLLSFSFYYIYPGPDLLKNPKLLIEILSNTS